MTINNINPNLKTLSELISLDQFINWFVSANTNQNTPIGENDYNAGYNTTVYMLHYPNTTTANNYQYNSPYLASLSSSNLNSVINHLLPLIYNLFANAIPYNQTMQNVILSNLNANHHDNVRTDNAPISAILPEQLLRALESYLSIYSNYILQYLTLNQKYQVQLSELNNNYSSTTTTTETINNIGQDNQLNLNSFNPVDTSSIANVQPLAVNELTDGGITTQTVNVENGANYSNNAHANANKQDRTATTNEVNVAILDNVGNAHTITVLKPLIYKISTLFWTLGNDYFPDEINWGFNIW